MLVSATVMLSYEGSYLVICISSMLCLHMFFCIALDTKMETCEEERSLLKRRLSAASVEIERQVKYS